MFKNRVTEADIREWLSQNGYFGRTAKFTEVELHAIRRPGWVQVFRFSVEAKSESGEWQQIFGVVCDDETQRSAAAKTRVEVFLNQEDQQDCLKRHSNGLLLLETERQSHPNRLLGLLVLFATIFGVGLLIVSLKIWLTNS